MAGGVDAIAAGITGCVEVAGAEGDALAAPLDPTEGETDGAEPAVDVAPELEDLEVLVGSTGGLPKAGGLPRAGGLFKTWGLGGIGRLGAGGRTGVAVATGALFFM